MAEDFNSSGNKAAAKGDYDSAVKAYSGGLAQPGSEGIRHILFANRSAAFCHLELWENALKDANMCIALRPNWGRAFASRGAALEGLGRMDEAREAYERAAELEPDDAELAEVARDMRAAAEKSVSNSSKVDNGKGNSSNAAFQSAAVLPPSLPSQHRPLTQEQLR